MNGGTIKANACAQVTGDIEASASSSTTWVPIQNFTGIFESKDESNAVSISNLTLTANASDDVGLFGSVKDGAIIRNIIMVNENIAGRSGVGGIVGNVSGTKVIIDGCGVNSEDNGAIKGYQNAGGLVGYVGENAQITIANSYNAGNVATNSSATSTTGLSKSDHNGLIGYVYKNATVALINCYNSYKVEDNEIAGIASTASVSASNVGCVYWIGSYSKCSVSNVSGISHYLNSGAADAFTENLTNATVQAEVSACYDESALGKMLIVDPDYISGVSGVTFSNTDNGVTATLSDAGGVLSIPQDIAVDTVVLDRAFDTELSSSTVMLPFEIAATNVENAEFFNVTGVTSAGGTAETENSTIEAYKPYLVKPKQSAITFKGAVTLKQTSDNEEESYTIGDWSFRGRITNKTWLEADVDGKAYTYSPKALTNGIAKGEFAKIGKNVRVRTMRAYLYYTGDAEKPLAKPAADAMLMSTEEIEVEDLPSTIPMTFIHKDIIVSQDSAIASIEGEDNGTLAIEKISTQMPAVSSDRWFDLKGRRLNGRPQTRGTYLHNKTLVTIK